MAANRKAKQKGSVLNVTNHLEKDSVKPSMTGRQKVRHHFCEGVFSGILEYVIFTSSFKEFSLQGS